MAEQVNAVLGFSRDHIEIATTEQPLRIAQSLTTSKFYNWGHTEEAS